MSGEQPTFGVALALGPVGVFIAGGRRSRDLWYGSTFLSRVTCAAATVLAEAPGVTLAVPTKSRLEAIRGEDDESRRATISNKVLALVQGRSEGDVHDLVQRSHAKARGFLLGEIEALRTSKRFTGLLVDGLVVKEIDAIQQGDFLEFYAAWVAVTPERDEEAALRRARELVDARKRTRGFGGAASSAGVAKSSLDPGRDSVLDEADPRTQPNLARRLRVARREVGIDDVERLDAIGVARRRAAIRHLDDESLQPAPFLPLTRVAADPWIAGAWKGAPDSMKRVSQTLERLRTGRVGDDAKASRSAFWLISSAWRTDVREADFPYDPAVLFASGLGALRRSLDERKSAHRNHPTDPTRSDHGDDSGATRAHEVARTTLDELRGPVERLHRRWGVPMPYYALIEADGDGIGELIGSKQGPERTRLIEALYDFADAASKSIRGCGGCDFYVGGDELAAYLPLDRVLGLVATLASHFRERVTSVEGKATLSFGVVVAHVRDDLRATRERARRALHDAKQLRRARRDRHGWVWIQEEPRGADGRACYGRIEAGDEPPLGLLCDLHHWMRLLDGRSLSLSTAYQLLELAARFDAGGAAGDVGVQLARSLIGGKRRLQEADASADDPTAAAKARLDSRTAALKTWRDVRALANEMLLANRIARAAGQREA